MEGAGWGAIIHLAIIASMDTGIYEVARIDGATRFQQPYKITLFVTVAGTLLSLLVTSMMAYPLFIRSLHFADKITFFAFLRCFFMEDWPPGTL